MVLNALWIVYSSLIHRLLENHKINLDSETQIVIKQVDELVCIARWFLRYVRQEIFPLLVFRGGEA